MTDGWEDRKHRKDLAFYKQLARESIERIEAVRVTSSLSSCPSDVGSEGIEGGVLLSPYTRPRT
jgi:hypothetical protein